MAYSGNKKKEMSGNVQLDMSNRGFCPSCHYKDLEHLKENILEDDLLFQRTETAAAYDSVIYRDVYLLCPNLSLEIFLASCETLFEENDFCVSIPLFGKASFKELGRGKSLHKG